MENNTEASPKSNLVLMIIVAVVLFGVAGYFLLTKYSPSASPASQEAANQQITNQPSKVRVITMSELQGHTQKTDCWVAMEGNVYDVTTFVPGNPSEEEILLGCGKDATQMLTSLSERTRVQLDTFKIGVLD